ncbi:recombinase family protein [Bacillus cereus]
MTVMGVVNQLERDLIRMRQREGIDLAKKKESIEEELKSIMKSMLE